MAGRRDPLRVWLVPGLVAAGALGLILAGRATASLPRSSGYGEVPAFSLTDQHGRPVSRETLAGRVWVAGFVFTRCAGQCPMMTARMQALASQAGAEDVTLVSISVDPAWDTPQVLARYAEQTAPEGQPWLFLTGEEAEIGRLCRDGFRLSLAEDGGTAEEPITHSTRLVLVDGAGVIRGYYETDDAGQLAQLPRDIRALLGEGS